MKTSKLHLSKINASKKVFSKGDYEPGGKAWDPNAAVKCLAGGPPQTGIPGEIDLRPPPSKISKTTCTKCWDKW